MTNSPHTGSSVPLTIIVEETAGIDRFNEPVTVGIPFPKGLLTDLSDLMLLDSERGNIPLQTQTLAKWPEGSCKWILLDFQVSVKANNTTELKVKCDNRDKNEGNEFGISISRGQNFLHIDTKAASFYFNNNVFKPFERVVIDGNEILDSAESRVVMTNDNGMEYEPLIKKIYFETEGKLRSTVKVEGRFTTKDKKNFANFFSTLNYFANSSLVKIQFTIHNPKAAKHPGGLWDLGDAGSIYFKDLSIHTALNSSHQLSAISYRLNDELLCNQLSAISDQLIIYQDSSGGENWRSLNHVNRNGEVKNSFKGYRVYQNGNVIGEGLRASPVISLNSGGRQLAGAVQYFWQNFPKAVEAKGNSLAIRLFPHQYDDVFELQGGEQKTHTIYLDFDSKGMETALNWIQHPLIPHAPPEWYSESKAIPYLIPENYLDGELSKKRSSLTGGRKGDGDQIQTSSANEVINSAIKGNNTFFERREIIDEYGWRNFGELYADHEAVGHKGNEPLIAHYNNQYDCIYGSLIQFLSSGKMKWFTLADQLCSHVKDIDIYHTVDDRPEYNSGLFWHTDHYMSACTATHRCFSQKNAESRNMPNYGGGPSLSHNYSTGFLYHYFLTGSYSSMEAVKNLASFVESNIDSEYTVANYIMRGLKKAKSSFNNVISGQDLISIDKVYGLDGPGRASGNALNTLIDVYVLTDNKQYLKNAEDLILSCIDPDDDIGKRDLLDTENRWMYTVFLQSLGRYLDVKSEREQYDDMWHYAKESLLNYATWMTENEYPYLQMPEKLEYPNETWAVQDIRKCNVLLYAVKYADLHSQNIFMNKGRFFYKKGLKYLLKYETRSLTRPIALLMLNGMMFEYFNNSKENTISPVMNSPLDKRGYRRIEKRRVSFNFSPRGNFEFLKRRILSR